MLLNKYFLFYFCDNDALKSNMIAHQYPVRYSKLE